MTVRATVDVTIYDDETHAVIERLHYSESSSLGWEVENLFGRIGDAVARKVDPQYYADEREP